MIGAKEIGPISSAQLRKLAESKELRKRDLVRRESKESWVKAEQIPGLFTRHKEQSNPEPTKSIKKTSSKKRQKQAADKFDRFYESFRYVRWASPVILAIPYFILLRRMSYFIVENSVVVERPEGYGLLGTRIVTPVMGTLFWLIGLFGVLTFAHLIFATDYWLRKTDNGRFWFDISSVGSLTAFRIVVSLIAIAAGAMLYLSVGLLFEGPRVDSPSFSWAIGLG